MDARIVKLGSAYFNRGPILPGQALPATLFSIGDTHPGTELKWVNTCGILVADRNICTNISWVALNLLGYIYGKYIQIDGRLYLCRCMTGGKSFEKPNEWDKILDTTGDAGELWHWKGESFWCQEAPNSEVNLPDLRVIRGCSAARGWSVTGLATQSKKIGFRPILEPLIPFPDDPSSLIGHPLHCFTTYGEAVRGMVIEADDYDLTLQVTSPLPKSCKKTAIPGVVDHFVVSRRNIPWMRGELALPEK